MNSQPEPSTDPRSGPGSRDLLGHYQEFADAVGAALGADGISDMMRLVRITQAHVRLTRAVR
jgi:hypothetical protein